MSEAVYYQPKIDLAKGVTIGVEALVRWQHASGGLMPPALFIPYAEQTGFVRHVTQWMLNRSIAQCGRWFADGRKCRSTFPPGTSST